MVAPAVADMPLESVRPLRFGIDPRWSKGMDGPTVCTPSLIRRERKIHRRGCSQRQVQDLKADTLAPLLDAFVSVGAELLVTDEFKSYAKAAGGRRHETVCHSETFVNGNVHTMGMENFWSLFKRAIIGVYHRVSAKYLQAYINEFVFRFNNRYNEDIFELVLGNC